MVLLSRYVRSVNRFHFSAVLTGMQNLAQIEACAKTGFDLPIASLRYLCPISLRYSSMALVARVFSLKIRCSRSMNLSTSHIAMSDRKSCKRRRRTNHQLITRPKEQTQVLLLPRVLVPTLAFPVLCSMCTSAHATSSLLLTLSTGSSTAHMVR